MIDEIIKTALKEDIGDGDHSSLSCVPRDAKGTAKLIVKADGILAGIELAERIFKLYDPSLVIDVKIKQILGVIITDNGKTELEFQIRKGKDILTLDPSIWLYKGQ